MSLLSALATMMQQNGNPTKASKFLSGVNRIGDSLFSGNPGYDRVAQSYESLLRQRLQNKNLPELNALQNALMQQKIKSMQLQNQFAPETIKNRNALQAAQAQMLSKRLENPFYGRIMPGSAGEVQGLDFVKQKYGPDSPEYKMAKEQFDANLLWRKNLGLTLPTRAATSMGKQQIERSNVASGYTPVGTLPEQQIGNIAQGAAERNMYQQPQNALARAVMAPNEGGTAINQGQPAQQSTENQSQPAQQANLTTENGDFYASHAYANNPNLRQYDIEANKKAVDTDTWKQFNAAREIEAYARSPEVRNSLESYAKYAGIFGRGKKFLESLKVNKPDTYKEALEAKKITIQNLSNLQRRMERLGVQNETRKEIKSMFDGATELMTTDPSTALSLINKGLKQLSIYSDKLYNTAQPIRRVFEPAPFVPIGQSVDAQPAANQKQNSAQNLSQEDIEATAQKYGMTPEQVKRILGVN